MEMRDVNLRHLLRRRSAAYCDSGTSSESGVESGVATGVGMGEERQMGHDALRRSHASRHVRWNLCLHSGITRSISPSLYSQRQMEHATSASAPAPAPALEKGTLGYEAMTEGSSPTGDAAEAAPREEDPGES